MTHVHINGAPSLNLSVRRAQVVPRRRPPHVTLCDGVCVRVVSVAAPYYTAQYSRRAQQQQGAPAHPLSASWAAVGAHPAARRAAQRRRPVPGYDRAVPPRRLKALRAAQHLGPKRRLLAVHAARRAAALPRCRAAALPRRCAWKHARSHRMPLVVRSAGGGTPRADWSQRDARPEPRVLTSGRPIRDRRRRRIRRSPVARCAAACRVRISPNPARTLCRVWPGRSWTNQTSRRRRSRLS
jgi:hypothetical protein